MKGYLGIDTSNYTTSTAVYCPEHDLVLQKKKLLPVPAGALGLRQSDAVFHHTVQLPQLLEELSAEFGGEIRAVAVSNAPRDAEGSYMPCFLAGMSAARAIAYHGGRPIYSAAELSAGDQLHLKWADGGAQCAILEVDP